MKEIPAIRYLAFLALLIILFTAFMAVRCSAPKLKADRDALLEAATYATCGESCHHNRCQGLRVAIAKAEGK